MASTVLPQALITIPRNPSQCSLKRIGFSMALSRRSVVAGSSLSVGRVSPSSVWSNSSPLLARRGFVVRAEASSEGEVADSSEEIVDVGGDVVAEAEEQPKTPWKPRVKLGDVMGILNKRAVEASESERPIPDIRTGDIVMIKLEVPENKRRLSIYKGIVISRQNAGIHTTIRVRRIIAGVGVEIVFPMYSPNIKEIRVVSHRKVRRARLYYLRDKLPRLSTFK